MIPHVKPTNPSDFAINNKIPALKGNDVELLIDGKATFESIFKGIDQAKDYVLVQFFIVDDDGLGRELKSLK